MAYSFGRDLALVVCRLFAERSDRFGHTWLERSTDNTMVDADLEQLLSVFLIGDLRANTKTRDFRLRMLCFVEHSQARHGSDPRFEIA